MNFFGYFQRNRGNRRKEVTSSIYEHMRSILWIVNSFLECTCPASYHFSSSDCFFAQRKVVLPCQVKWDFDKILPMKLKPYQVKHVEDQKQVVKGFVNSLEMQKWIFNCWFWAEFTTRVERRDKMDKNQFDKLWVDFTPVLRDQQHG